MGEKLPRILPKVATSTSLLGSFTCRKFTTWDRRLYFPSEGRSAEDIFARKIRRLRPGLNPRTSRPPKPLQSVIIVVVIIIFFYYYIREEIFADVQIRSVVNLSFVKSKIRLFALIEGFRLAVKLCTWHVGIFMSYLPNHYQIHYSNCSFVITVKHVSTATV